MMVLYWTIQTSSLASSSKSFSYPHRIRSMTASVDWTIWSRGRSGVEVVKVLNSSKGFLVIQLSLAGGRGGVFLVGLEDFIFKPNPSETGWQKYAPLTSSGYRYLF